MFVNLYHAIKRHRQKNLKSHTQLHNTLTICSQNIPEKLTVIRLGRMISWRNRSLAECSRVKQTQSSLARHYLQICLNLTRSSVWPVTLVYRTFQMQTHAKPISFHSSSTLITPVSCNVTKLFILLFSFRPSFTYFRPIFSSPSSFRTPSDSTASEDTKHTQL